MPSSFILSLFNMCFWLYVNLLLFQFGFKFLIGEAERIKRCKGRVFALHDEPEVPRVWLPFDDAPGLAMARAFGDFCLKEYGVISIPEFSHRLLTDRDQFIVLASDGVRILNLMTTSIFIYLFIIC